ncbi:ABC transporter ATP-binding protein [Tsukamurella sp. 8F]|uniref:ABC transporter ATP-binding protein n=1 Tax=unclassified Tsukamurella TaxID=2633480 RepID=UPI0023B8BFAF|nr:MULTISPECIES: ABC transporter ATP-binding protein [unclassified Tsukamurella]MDF0531267.1 ABC transporter ATP-binding protein [Tsukamurella sp. 8J]MDF0585216.1 ABC transporter ATP-binding protein [Tsukamurella sp. 8F]
MVLSAASVPFAILTLVALVEVCRHLMSGGGQAWWWGAASAGAAAVHVLLYNHALRVSHLADARFRLLVRTRLADHIGELGLGWFDAGGTGEVKQALSDDVKRMHVLVAHLPIDVVPTVLTPVAGMAYLYAVDWVYAAAFTAYLAVAALVVVPAFRKDYEESASAYTRALVELTRATVELGDGIEVLKTYPSRSSLSERFSRAVDDLVAICVRWMSTTGRPTALAGIMLSPAALIAVLTALGLWLVEAGRATPTAVIAFLIVGVGVPVSVLHLGSMRGIIRAGQAGASHIGRILATPGPCQPSRPVEMRSSRIEFDHVTFGYHADRRVLDDVDFAVEPGTFTAVVGPSGSGKTTLSRLIARFWDVDRGTVRVGGVDVREQNSSSLLGSMVLVFQDVTVLRDTARENIRLGRTWITDAQVVDAARRAQIHDVIDGLPQGYDTELDAAGGGLSGGEQQRLTIARAIVSHPRMVVLDEATAHVDPENEVLIQRALSELAAEGATLFVVAHRLHTIVHADQILVLDEGRIVQRGTHAELLDGDGLYRRMWRSAQAVNE